MSDWDSFQKKYSEAPEKVRQFIDSDRIPELAEEALVIRSRVTPRTSDLILAISDYALGIGDKRDLSASLGISGIELDAFAKKINDYGTTNALEVSPVTPQPVTSTQKEAVSLPVRTNHQAPIIPPIPPAPVPVPAPTTTQTQEPMRPLTRDELMQALEHRGQAGGNLDAIRQKLAAAASQPVIGYDALPPNEERAQ